MSIEIIRQQPLRMTQSELNRLRDEYNSIYSFYCGTPPAFEDWARERIATHGAADQKGNG